jgi:hypothetical protein
MHEQTIRRRPHRPVHLVLGAAAAGLALALTGCTDSGAAGPPSSATAPDSAPATTSATTVPTAGTTGSHAASSTASTTAAPDTSTPAVADELPAVPLEEGPYEGEPRRLGCSTWPAWRP